MASAERVTVTLPADLVEQIDRVERNRSRFIAEAVDRNSGAAAGKPLLRSISDPHPEAELADASRADWASDLPAEEELVDSAAGTPVRWVEGAGWVLERS